MPRKKIEPAEIKRRGKKQWYVQTPKELNGGKSRRQFFRTFAGAEARSRELEEMRSSSVRRLLALPEEKQIAILQAVEVIGERITELPDAARAYLTTSRKEFRTVADTVADCIASREKMGNREASMNSLKSTLNRFKEGREARTIDTVTPAEVDGWLSGLTVAKGKLRGGQPISRPTRRTYLTDLRTLFSFAMSRGFCSSNPARAIERPAHEDMPRGILTVEQSKMVLEWVRENDPGMLSCIALTLFAGIRPDEARWIKATDLKGDLIVIGGDSAKGRQRRIVEINETLKSWLAIPSEFPPHESGFKERVEAIHALVKPWPHDALRHSFVSYRCAIVGIKTTAQEAAHSEDTLLRHYRALTTRDEAEKFWALSPL